MATSPFMWGAGGEMLSPAAVKRNREVAAELAKRGMQPVKTIGDGLTMVGNALSARWAREAANEAETAGQKRVSELMAGLGDGADQAELIAAMSDPWMADNPAGSMVAQTMLQREMQKQDPLYQIGLEKSQLELEGLRNPAPEAPDLVELFDEDTGLPYKAKWTGSGYERVGGVKAPSGMQISTNADGTFSFSQGTGLKPLTEGQSKDTVYATRAAGTLPILDKLGDALTDLGGNLAGNAGVLGNYMKTPEYQQAEQAGLEFVQAILRKDTGAAITPAETAEYGKVYLPRPGDSPAVREQKRVSRIRALEAIEAGLPPAAIIARDKAIIETTEAAGGAAEAPMIASDAEYDALPSGATFKAPDGTVRRKP